MARTKVIFVDLEHQGGRRWVMTVRAANSTKWVEIRGEVDGAPNYLQEVIDSLSGPLVGGMLFAGEVAAVDSVRMYNDDYPILAKLLDEHS
jgi:hypothetical protein